MYILNPCNNFIRTEQILLITSHNLVTVKVNCFFSTPAVNFTSELQRQCKNVRCAKMHVESRFSYETKSDMCTRDELIHMVSLESLSTIVNNASSCQLLHGSHWMKYVVLFPSGVTLTVLFLSNYSRNNRLRKWSSYSNFSSQEAVNQPSL